VEQVTVLVGSDGKWLLPDSEDFLAELGDPDPDYDAVGFAVRNLGFIKYRMLDRLVTEIELHPRNVDPRALRAVERQLAQASTKLFRISYLNSEWRSEISASAAHTVARLYELCAPAFAPQSAEKFVAEPKDQGVLSRDGAPPLRLLARKWRTAFGNFDTSVISFALSHQLLGRMVIAEITPGSLDPVFRYIGEGLTAMGKGLAFEGIGRRMENVPDKDYGQWLIGFYKAVAISGQPRYDVVTARVRDPACKEPQAIRYERLLLPWKTESDEVLVSLVSNRVSEPSEPDFATLAGSPSRKLVKSS
jgi:hypothetical protein